MKGIHQRGLISNIVDYCDTNHRFKRQILVSFAWLILEICTAKYIIYSIKGVRAISNCKPAAISILCCQSKTTNFFPLYPFKEMLSNSLQLPSQEMVITLMLRPLDLENSIFPEDGRDFSGKLKVKHKVSCFLKNYNVIIRALDVIQRSSRKVENKNKKGKQGLW